MIIGVANVFSVTIALLTIDKIGRKKLLLIGSWGAAIANHPLLGRMLEERFNMQLIRSPFGEDAAFGACTSAMTGGRYISDDALWAG